MTVWSQKDESIQPNEFPGVKLAISYSFQVVKAQSNLASSSWGRLIFVLAVILKQNPSDSSTLRSKFDTEIEAMQYGSSQATRSAKV